MTKEVFVPEQDLESDGRAATSDIETTETDYPQSVGTLRASESDSSSEAALQTMYPKQSVDENSSYDKKNHDGKEEYYRDDSERDQDFPEERESATSGITVNGSTIEAGRNVIITEGDYYDIIQYESSYTPVFEQVSEESIRKDYRLFVPPKGFPEEEDLLLERRIWILYGPEHSGKRIASVNLARRLRGLSQRSICYYVRPDNSPITLLEAVRHDESEKDAILILEDVFDKNVQLRELLSVNLDSLLRQLIESNNYLILTAEIESDSVESLSSQEIGIIDSKQGQLNLIYRTHIDVLLGQDEMDRRPALQSTLTRLWSSLESLLRTAFHIRRFYDKVSTQLESLPNSEQELSNALKSIAEQVAHIGSSGLRRWFSELKSNDKVFALMSYLLEGYDLIWIESIYKKIIDTARATGWSWLDDPREIGIIESLERIQCEVHAKRVQFIEKAYRLEVRRQVENHTTLACFILEFLIEDIFLERSAWEAPWRRHGFGRALAGIGIHRHEWYKSQLDRLATARDKKLAVISGYSLQEAFHSDPGGMAGFILKTLREWIRSKDSSLIWAAGAALPKVYRRPSHDDMTVIVSGVDYPSRIRRLIVDLCRHAGKFREMEEARQRKEANLWLASQDLCEIFLQDPDNISKLIGKCLSKPHPDIQLAARRATGLIFDSFSREQRIPTVVQLAPILQLVESTLEHIGADTDDFQKVFLALRSWTRAEEILSSITALFLRIASFSTEGVRDRLCAGLIRFWLCRCPESVNRLAEKICHKEPHKKAALVEFWLGQDREAIVTSTLDVITRAYAMSGVVVESPELGRGVVIVDSMLFKAEEVPSVKAEDGPSVKAEAKQAVKDEERASAAKQRKLSFLWNLLSTLEVHVDISVVYVGSDLVFDMDHDVERNVARFCSSSPLVIPGVEATNMLMPSVAMVVTERKFQDLGDLVMSMWADNLFLVHTGRVDVALPGERCIEISWPPKDRDEARVEEVLGKHWARQVAFCAPEAWLPVLRALLIDLSGGPNVEALLEVWLEQIANSEWSYDVDPARKAVTTVLWLASVELESCLELLRRWLIPREEDPLSLARTAIAAAASRSLLRVHTAYEAHDGLCAPTLLFAELAGPLAARSSDDLDCVVGFVRHWMAEPVWTAYLAGGVEEGRGRFHRWAEPFIGRCPLLRTTLEEFASLARPEAASWTWESLLATVDRLLVRFALSAPSNLRPIKPNERYLLLLVDTRDYGPETRKRIDEAAKKLFREAVEESERGWVPIVYRMGERYPCWGESAELPENISFLAPGVDLPALVGPVLASAELGVGWVAAALILTGGVVIDLDDWKETPWSEKIVVQSFENENRHSPTFPAPPDWASNLSDYFPILTKERERP